jgi:hypothetical protein
MKHTSSVAAKKYLPSTVRDVSNTFVLFVRRLVTGPTRQKVSSKKVIVGHIKRIWSFLNLWVTFQNEYFGAMEIK